MSSTKGIKISQLFCLLCLLTFVLQIAAQQRKTPQTSGKPNTSTTATDGKTDDISITANVTARELKFEIVPNPTVEFTGKPERQTVWEADRQNLPRPVEPGVTYRNIGIQLRITSRFADIERIVAEALGEIPISDDAPKNNVAAQTQTSGTAPPANGETQKPTAAKNKKP